MGAQVPRLDDIDHIHVYVADREAAQRWYAEVLGLAPVDHLREWAADGGPLTIGNPGGSIHIALFERPAQACRSTIALSCGATAFVDWQRRLCTALGKPMEPVDHALSWSLYFTDPDGNPYEITSYEHAEIRALLGGAQQQ